MVMVPEQNLAAVKQALAVEEAKIWRVTVASTPQLAADFLNASPAQVAGEAMVSNRPDGMVDVYFFL